MSHAGLQWYKPHDFRRTFGSLVARHSGDSHLVERLLRHGKPSVTDRYIQWDLPDLLERYSPVHLARLPGQETELTCQPGRKAYPNWSRAWRDSIIFTGLMGRKVRDTLTSPAKLSKV